MALFWFGIGFLVVGTVVAFSSAAQLVKDLRTVYRELKGRKL